LALAVVIGCSPADAPANRGDVSTMKAQQLSAELAVVRQARILFSHHSVGQNIVAGLARLDVEAGGGQLRLASIEEAATIEGPVLAHGGGGKNGEPRTKIDFFAAVIRDEPRLKPDLAFMKLCYVDFDPRTDVEDLFSHYQRTLASLKREHPGIRFAHFTVPLVTRPTDLKSTLRRLLGREVWEDAANVKRFEFNRRLTETFASDPVFDLAMTEATGPGGDVERFEFGGRLYPSMYAPYTDDGGHLNTLGQRVVGSAVTRFLAGALPDHRPPQ
jgi:hypothetical protein